MAWWATRYDTRAMAFPFTGHSIDYYNLLIDRFQGDQVWFSGELVWTAELRTVQDTYSFFRIGTNNKGYPSAQFY